MPTAEERLKERQKLLGAAPEKRLVAPPIQSVQEKLLARQEGLSGVGATLGAASGASLRPGEAEARGQRQELRSTAAMGRRNIALSGALGQMGVGQEDLTFGERFDLGMSDIFEEKRAKFLDKFPEGHFERIPATFTDEQGQIVTEDEVVFSRGPDEPFSRVDRPTFEAMGDIADLSGDLPAIAGEILLTKGSASLVSNAIRIFTGGGGAELLKQGVEELRGFQRESFEEATQRAGAQGFIGVVGQGLARVLLSGPVNLIRGAPRLRMVPGASRAMRTAVEEDLPQLLPGEIAQSGLVRRIQSQSAATVSAVNRYVIDQQQAIMATVRDLKEADLTRLVKGDLETLSRDANKQILDFVKAVDVNASDAGRVLQRGLTAWDQTMRTVVDRAYGLAREVEPPKLDLTTAKRVAQQVLDGLPAPRTQGGTVNAEPATKELRKLAQDIIDIDPNFKAFEAPGGRTVDIVEVVRAFRQQAFDLAEAPTGQNVLRTTADQKKAKSIAAGLKDSLDNPINSNPEFIAAWQQANKLAAGRFGVLEQTQITQLAKAQDFAGLANKLVGRNQADNVRAVREVLDPDDFLEFQNFAAFKMADDGLEKLPSKLRAIDDDTLNAVFTPEQRKSLEQTARAAEQLETIGIDRILAKQDTTRGIIDNLVNSGDTVAAGNLRKTIGALESPAGRSIRAGIVERVIDNSTVVTKEFGARLDGAKLRSEIEALKKSGMIDFLTRSDKRALLRAEDFIRFLPGGTDTGTSLVAAQSARQAGELITPKGFTSTGLEDFAGDVIEMMGIGRIMTSPTLARALLGTGTTAKPINFDVLGAALAQFATDNSNQEIENGG